MRRRKALGADPEKVRAFQQRAREKTAEKQRQASANGALPRSELARRGKGGVNPPRPENASTAVAGPLSPAEWRVAVWTLDLGRCVGCGREVPRDADRWTWQAHHPIPKQKLPPGKKYDPRNGVTLCRRCHERHESVTHRIPGYRLPERAWSFARECGFWAEDVLNRLHPGGPGDGDQSRGIINEGEGDVA